MGKSDGSHHSGRKNKSNSRMNYLKQVKQGGGGGGGGYRGHGGRGGGRGGGGGDYVSAYGRDGQKKRQRHYLGPGMRGFLLTTNFRENDCVRDGYNLLNEYFRPEDEEMKEATTSTTAAEESVDAKPILEGDQGLKEETKMEDSQEGASGGGDAAPAPVVSTLSADDTDMKKEKDDDDDDIDKALEKEMRELKSNTKFKFTSVDTGLRNVVFIKTDLHRPTEIAYRIFNDVYEKKETRCRNILRFIPIEGTCRSDDQSIRKLAKEIFTPYFEKGYKSFKIIINIRHSNLPKDQMIKTLADIVGEINPLNVVNLTDPEYTIVAEIIKTTMLLSVLRDFTKFKKFNITEIVSPTPIAPPKIKSDPEQGTQEEGTASATTSASPNKNTDNAANEDSGEAEQKLKMEVGCDKEESFAVEKSEEKVE